VIGERYQTHPIICHSNHQNLIIKEHKNSLINFYIEPASYNLYYTQPKDHAKMVLEVNNTKAMLFYLLESNYKDDTKLVNTIIEFTKFHCTIGDHSDKLIS
jgi:hypothetical protein